MTISSYKSGRCETKFCGKLDIFGSNVGSNFDLEKLLQLRYLQQEHPLVSDLCSSYQL